MAKKRRNSSTGYSLHVVDGELAETHPPIEDEGEETPTEVTKLHEELEAKMEASCERMDDVAKKADFLRKSVVDDRRSYPKMAAVVANSDRSSKK